MKRARNSLNPEADAESFIHAWFPSYRRITQKKGFKLLNFFRDHNKFYNIGPKSTRRIFQDKFLLSAYLAGIGISTPVTRWIVVQDTAFSPEGRRIPTSDLVRLLSSGRWFVKARSGSGGEGAFLLDHGMIRKADGSAEAVGKTNLLRLLKAHKSTLVQDVVVQSEDYAVFSPSSLNTIRCLTYLGRTGKVEIVAATLRMGTGNSVVDNVSVGGLYCGIDLDSHRLIHPGLIDEGKILGSKSFERHPTSNIVLPGYKLERLEDIFAICKSAHEALGGPMTVGWDVAMTDAGPCIIEGNAGWTATLHSLADPKVKSRLSAFFLRDYKISGAGYPADQQPMERNSLATVAFRVKGKVQRVGYRKWVTKLATEKGLRGQATNLDSGDVEVSLTGPLRLLEFAVFACMSGPHKAKVSEIEILSLAPYRQADRSARAPASKAKPARSAPSVPIKVPSARIDDGEITAYIHDTRYEDIPAEVIQRAKVLLLDSLGTIILGSGHPAAVPITNIAREVAGAQEAAIFGTDLRRSSQMAAFANAAYAQIHDFNDGHRIAAATGASAHPGRIVVPTALAECERRKATGKELLTALVIGYDVACKIRGGSVGTKSSFYAAAAVAARLRGQSIAQISTAMGLAGYASQSRFGSRIPANMDPYSRGLCARIGIEAAIAAGAGQKGPKLRDDPAVSLRFAERGLGTSFEIMNVYLKPFPTCRMTHGSLEALLKIRRDMNFGPDDIDKILVRQLPKGMYVARAQPEADMSYKRAQFNLYYCLARAVLDGELTVRQFERDSIDDPRVRDLAARIEIVSDKALGRSYPEQTRSSSVTVTLKDGRTNSLQVDLPKGDPTNFLTTEEVKLKFMSNASPVLGQAAAEKIVELVQEIETAESLQELVSCLCMSPEAPVDLLRRNRQSFLSTLGESPSPTAIKDTRKSSQRRFSKEFQDEAVRLALTSGRNHHEIAADLGVGQSTLRHWIRRRGREIEHPPEGRQEKVAAEQHLMR
ncbi:MmgE/PrpD family protein [Microvirga makkahensis]|uniref:acylphosphatase n=1 Tax=Microvirga makkahensis TaxID=1128670 RepID=A0A7X3SR50_9HYPH|nr:MmgE/PrpD family protein [Microvirga makkahensis]MXQ14256.1 transposase [Microvirga makkahensis]